MRRVMFAVLGLALLGVAGFFILTDPSLVRAGLEPIPPGEANVENGRVLFTAGGCSSCHAVPGQDDKTKLGGGLALKTPFGTFHVPNISPDKADGLGAWSVADFVRAMRGGVAPDGAHLYPAFPYTSYQRMPAGDLRDMFAYIATLPAVQGRAPPHELPFPFDIRRGLGLWKLMFLDGRAFAADPQKSAALNRGAYLVEGPGHCAECHSPRNALGAIVTARRFAGGPDPEGKGRIPNISQGTDGIGGWTRDNIVELLTTGFTPDYDSVGSSMADVVAHMSKLPQADREAMADYLLSLPQLPNK